ncbi:hypothetical protein DUPY_21870 [Duganella phyllosphaerae]|uniref:NAD-specific glutamate dehydrogenase n=1 Tax=Duganella phyllosphaerae TaxID=762836 RepID=A0A1E7WPU1_9BURK|nr:hypothetical protein DUPY_21870 [Duganella phyllosphaerae]
MARAATAQLDRLCARVQVRLEAGNHFTRQGLLDQLLDILEHVVFIDTHQRHRFAGGARAAGTADAVHIVFRHVRQVVVDHVRQLVDVDTARGDVGGDQHLQRAVLELAQRAGTGRLALVAVNGHGGDAVATQFFHQVVGAVLGAGKYQHLGPLVGLDQVGQHRVLLVAVDRVDLLRDHFHGRVAAGDFNRCRVVQQAIGQGLDLVREGGREQQVLAFRRQHGQHFLDVADEAHVEHAVGFVQDQHFDLAQIDGALLHVVEQAARGGDQDVDAVFQLLDLRVDADAAEDYGRVQLGVLAVGAHAFFDLGRQFAGRGQDQGADGARRAIGREGLADSAGRQQLQQRQGEAGGLAGAGLGACQQVAAVEDGRNGLGLDRRRGGVAGVGNSADDSIGQTE